MQSVPPFADDDQTVAAPSPPHHSRWWGGSCSIGSADYVLHSRSPTWPGWPGVDRNKQQDIGHLTVDQLQGINRAVVDLTVAGVMRWFTAHLPDDPVRR